MNLGLASVRLLRKTTAALIASPVGVPFPSGVVAVICAVTSAALPAAIGTGMALVTEAAMHSEPSPSGNTLSPQETEASVAVTTSLTPGTTSAHLVSLLLLPLGFSFIDPERSSTIKISAGRRLRLKSCRAHSPFMTSPASALVSPTRFKVLPLPAVPEGPLPEPELAAVAPPALLPATPSPLFDPLGPPDEHATKTGTNSSRRAEDRIITPSNAAREDFDHSARKKDSHRSGLRSALPRSMACTRTSRSNAVCRERRILGNSDFAFAAFLRGAFLIGYSSTHVGG